MLKRVLVYTLFSCVISVTSIIITGGGFGEREMSGQLTIRPLIFAHKGLQKYYAENSIEAFIKSSQAGLSIEADVIQTKDEQLIIFHDRRATKVLGIEKAISELTFNEVKNKQLLHKGLRTKNQVLTLRELFRDLYGKATIYLDFKDASIEIADSVIRYMKMYNAYDSILIADQNISFLSYLKFKEPKIKTVLEGFYAHKVWMYYLIPKNFKPDFYACFLDEVTDFHIMFVKNANILDKEIVYGVNSENIQDVYKMGIKNIILDYDSSLIVLDLEEKLALHNQQKKAY